MSAALLMLLRLTWRGRLRRAWRGLRAPRGAILSLIGLIVTASWFGPSVWLARTRPVPDPDVVASVAASALLLILCSIALMPATAPGAAYFSPAEINFLFSGPFSRRALLVYKLGSALPRVAMAALLLTLIELAFVPWWVAACVGIFLAMLLLQLFGMAVALGIQTLVGRAHSRTRRLVLGCLAILSAVALWKLIVAVRPEGLLGRSSILWDSGVAGSLPPTPLDFFARTIAATTAPQLALWGSLALAVDAALLALVFWLDARWTEGALLASQRAFERVSRRRRGGGPLALLPPVRARWSLPMSPWLGGAGPLIWRQITAVVRQPWTFLGVAFFALVMLSSSFRAGPSAPNTAALVLVLGPLFGMWLQYDFRGDVEHLPVLKALPVRSGAIAVGEVAGGAILTTMVQFVALGAVAAATGDVWSPLITACFVPPLALMLFGAQNLMFLLVPARMAPATAGDFQHVARLALLWTLQLLMLIVGGVAVVAAGVVGARLAGGSWAVGLIASWAMSLAEAGALLSALAWAFRRFDVSLDTPP